MGKQENTKHQSEIIDETEEKELKEEKVKEEKVKEDLDGNNETVSDELTDEDEDSKVDYEIMYTQKQEELDELNNRFMRLQADFNNYKKRVEKEKETIYAYATEELMTELLTVLDNFDRALSSANDKEKDSALYEGVKMISDQFLVALKKAGLEEIDALNQKFDPNLHHGVAQEESDEYDEDTILQVFQKGYKLKDKVIRPSMVKISK